MNSGSFFFLSFRSLNTKKESFGHFFLHTTIPSCICVLFLLLLLTALALNPYSTVYALAIESNPNQYVLGVPQTKAVVADVLDYLWFGKPLHQDPSSQAVAHMADVRELFVVGETALLFLGILSFFALRRRTAQQKRQLLMRSSASALFVLVFFSLISLLGFDKIFTLFHKILFSNNLWLFPANDSLILYFPQYFFQSIAIQLLAWFVLILGGILLFLILKERQKQLSSSKPAQHI